MKTKRFIPKMLQVDDKQVINLMVRNSLALEMQQGYTGFLGEISNSFEDTVTIELTINEWNAVNTVTYYIYNMLVDRMGKTDSAMEQSALDNFLNDFETAVHKINHGL